MKSNFEFGEYNGIYAFTPNKDGLFEASFSGDPPFIFQEELM